MAKNKNNKKRTVKQWILRYMIIGIIIGSISTFIITSSNAAYRKSVSSSDSVRVAKWAFTLNDENITTLTTDPLDLLENSFYTGVNSIVSNGSTSYAASLVPGMKGVMTYQLKNNSEVDASIVSFSVVLKLEINNIREEMQTWDDAAWETWIRKIPIEWFITIVDQTNAGVTPTTIKILMDSYLNDYSLEDGLTANSKTLSTTWEVVTESNPALDFNLNSQYKVVQLNWEWAYNRYTEDIFYNETNKEETFAKTMTYTEYVTYKGTSINTEPSFTYVDSSNTAQTKTYSNISFDDYLDLYVYCQSQNDFSMLYKYLNYHEYLKWVNTFTQIPDDFYPSTAYDERQQLYLDEIDTKLSNLDVNISVLLSFKIVQKEPV